MVVQNGSVVEQGIMKIGLYPRTPLNKFRRPSIICEMRSRRMTNTVVERLDSGPVALVIVVIGGREPLDLAGVEENALAEFFGTLAVANSAKVQNLYIGE